MNYRKMNAQLFLYMSIRWSYHSLMKTYNISQLKANLSEAIRSVKKGNKVYILDRETPVATLIPVLKNEDNLKIRLPLLKRNISTVYTGIAIKVDIQKILQEDRNKR